jgi:hypothetical protein
MYKLWIDLDGDCQNTREEILNASNLDGQSNACSITTGRWRDPYSGDTITDPSLLDIDHVVPLAEAHRSGAAYWDSTRRMEFANDLTLTFALLAVSLSQNRSKGDDDPANWLPVDSSFWKSYVLDWVAIKVKWNLTADSVELVAIRRILGGDTAGIRFPMMAPELICTDSTATSSPGTEISSSSSSSADSTEIPVCSVHCTQGISKPCGNSCILPSYSCTKPIGAACFLQ